MAAAAIESVTAAAAAAAPFEGTFALRLLAFAREKPGPPLLLSEA